MELIHAVKKIAKSLVSSASDVRLINHIKENPKLLDSTHSIQFAVDDDVDSFLRGYISRDTPEEEKIIKPRYPIYRQSKLKRINYL